MKLCFKLDTSSDVAWSMVAFNMQPCLMGVHVHTQRSRKYNDLNFSAAIEKAQFHTGSSSVLLIILRDNHRLSWGKFGHFVEAMERQNSCAWLSYKEQEKLSSDACERQYLDQLEEVWEFCSVQEQFQFRADTFIKRV